MTAPNKSSQGQSLEVARLDSADKRRRRIVGWMQRHGAPISGSELARRFHVSRQCLVQDIAILRASGEQIVATPRGYRLPESSPILIERSLLAGMPPNEPRKNYRF